MGRCHSCGKAWPDDHARCPECGGTIGHGAAAEPAGTKPITGLTMTRTPSRSDARAAPAQTPASIRASTAPLRDPHRVEVGSVVGEYRIEGKLGQGGMGAVYAAVHPLIGKKAAIKVISPLLCSDELAVQRFVQEARAVNQIGHPNIVDVFSFGELPDGRSYFAMEWLQGETLGDRMESAPVPLSEALMILEQVADALEAAHEKHIVHRDLKPDNVFLVHVRGNRELVKLLDFGIAKLADPDGAGITNTRTGMMMGTPGYLSPEQARGKNVDHRTDIYSLGVLAFELACGRLPFEADTAMDMVVQHLNEQPPRPRELEPELPEPLETLILGMLSKDAGARPTLAEVRRVLADVNAGLDTREGKRAFRPRLRTPAAGVAVDGQAPKQEQAQEQRQDQGRRRSRTGLLVAALAMLAAGGVAFALVGGGGGDDASDTSAAPAVTPESDEPAEDEPDPVEDVAPAAPEHAGTIAVTVEAEGAEVTVDGNPVAVEDGRARATIDEAGVHTVAVTAPDHQPFETVVAVAGGATIDLPVTLQPAEKEPVAKKPPRRRPPRRKPPRRKKPPKKQPGGDYTLNPFGE